MLILPEETAPRTLSHHLKALITPRPIGWISTLDSAGTPNLAPYSFFNAVDDAPPLLIFSSNGWKHSLANASATGEFVHSLVTMDFAEAMNVTAALTPDGVSEFATAGLEREESVRVRPPRVRGAAASCECKVVEIKRLTDLGGRALDTWLVIGQVVAMHIADECLIEGRADFSGRRVVGRLAGSSYAPVANIFRLERPTRAP
jgi:flavin reductase (DIM6/NTAB) family NADH-FMN oxidoreductase RutF